jgi:hypothetical protein
VTEPETLRGASVFGTLALIFEALITETAETEILEIKAAYYRQRFEKAMEGARALVDTDGDGLGERDVRGGEIRLRRK